MLYLHNQLHKSWGGPYKWAPQGVKTQILAKNEPEYWYYAKNPPSFGHHNTQSNHKITFGLNVDAISTIAIAYEFGVTL